MQAPPDSKDFGQFEKISPTSSPEAPPSSAATSRRPRIRPLFYLVLAAASLVVFTAVALLQSPRPVPHPVSTFLSSDFWRYPIVLNEIKRLQAITVEGSFVSPDLNAVWTSGDAREVWIGGNSGVLLHSSTGGKAWEKVGPTSSSDADKSSSSSLSPDFWPTLPVVMAGGVDPVRENSQANGQAPPQPNPPAIQGRPLTLNTPDNSTQLGTMRGIQQVPVNSNTVYTPPGQTQSTQANPANLQAPATGTQSQPLPDKREIQDSAIRAKPANDQQINANTSLKPAPASLSVPCSFGAANIAQVYFSPLTGFVMFGPTALGQRWCTSNDQGRTWTVGDGPVHFSSQLRDSASPSITTAKGYQVQVGTRGSIKILNGPLPAQRVSHTTANLNAIAFSEDGQNGFVVGERGTALRTDDGGNTWFPVLQGLEGEYLPAQKPLQLPAPWYYLSWLLIAAIAWPALGGVPSTVLQSEESIANLGVSDRPLEPTDADPLGYKDLALSISRFLRNENTIAPITIAITGEWGTGKSSIMNLLRRDLAARGLRPIWFNVWHNQTEDDLFATILQNVRKQGVPYWWQLDYFSFRLRLLAMRWAHRLPPVTMLLMAIAFLAGIEWRHRNDHELNNLFLAKLG